MKRELKPTIFHTIFSTTTEVSIMAESQEDVFKKPEEPRPKTPTYEGASERPAKVRKVHIETDAEQIMSVL